MAALQRSAVAVSGLDQRLAYDIDEAAGILSVAMMGDVDDGAAIAFYRGLVRARPDLPRYDMIIDARHTDWVAGPEMVAAVGAMLRAAGHVSSRGLAVVRRNFDRDAAERQAGLLREATGVRAVQYFSALEPARAWLAALR